MINCLRFRKDVREFLIKVNLHFIIISFDKLWFKDSLYTYFKTHKNTLLFIITCLFPQISPITPWSDTTCNPLNSLKEIQKLWMFTCFSSRIQQLDTSDASLKDSSLQLSFKCPHQTFLRWYWTIICINEL